MIFLFVKIYNIKFRLNLESKWFVKDRLQGFPVNFCLELFIFLGQEVHLHIGVWWSTNIHNSQILSQNVLDKKKVEKKNAFYLCLNHSYYE